MLDFDLLLKLLNPIPGCFYFPLYMSLLFEKGPNSVDPNKLIFDDNFFPVNTCKDGGPILF